MEYEIYFFFSLFFTLFIEVLVLFFITKKIYKLNITNKKILISGLIATSLTLPYLWFIFPYFIKDFILYVLFGELFVLIVEMFIYYFLLKISLKKALIISFLCNFISFVLGLIIF